MLIYIILMLALAYFFQKEGQKLLAGKSKLLAEFCQDAYATKTALSTLRILCLSSAVSGFWMLIAFLENNLNADGSVSIPEALQPYMGGMKRIEKKTRA